MPRTSKALEQYAKKRRFDATPEPPPKKAKKTKHPLFVVQKHSASHLHFDLRFEHDGVLKSWALPNGPTLDPKVRRLAVYVEEHPVAYRDFEGIIPTGEYGGGTVMVWDRGPYAVVGDWDEGFAAGKLDLVLHGERLKGSFALVRTKERRSWLFIKHTDAYVQRGAVFSNDDRSIQSGRTMREIAEAEGRVWHSHKRNKKSPGFERVEGFTPMLLTMVERLPHGSDWQYEPKFDGYRVLAFATPQGTTLLSRTGVDLTATYPTLSRAITALTGNDTLVIDGELVMTHDGRPLGFEAIQRNQGTPTLIAFDLLLHRGQALLQVPLGERQKQLRAWLQPSEQVQLAPVLKGSDQDVLLEATRLGWEGVVAKKKNSVYRPGVRSLDWVKYKLPQLIDVYVLGMVIKKGEPAFSSLCVAMSVPAQGGLRFAGHVGSGLEQPLRRLLTDKLRLITRATAAIPVSEVQPHTVWVEPCVRVRVRYREVSSDGHLRQPVLVG